MKQYVFIPCVELEFWLLLSIAKQLKELYPDRKQTLISLSHTRLVGRFEEEKTHFDEVIEFPWFQPSITHFFKTIYLSHQFSQLLSKSFPKDTSFFCCGFGQFMHHHILDYIIKKQWRYINIQLYPSKKQSLSNVFNWQYTFIHSLFFFLRFGYLSLYYQLKNSIIFSKITYTTIFKKWSVPNHIIININHDHHPYEECTYIDHCPNPYLCLEEPLSTLCKLNGPCILLLLADDIAQKTPSYYTQVSTLTDYLYQHYPSHSIYVKFHPQISDNFESIQSPHYLPLDKTISAETLFLLNLSKISAVFGSYSTALGVATDFKIPSYDCSRFFGIDEEPAFEQYANQHYHNKPVNYINNKHDLAKISPTKQESIVKESTNTFRQLLQQLDLVS